MNVVCWNHASGPTLTLVEDILIKMYIQIENNGVPIVSHMAASKTSYWSTIEIQSQCF